MSRPDLLTVTHPSAAHLCRQEKHGLLELPAISDSSDGLVSEQLCAAAAQTADALRARAIFVFTRRGVMASLLSRCRPDAPIFAFTGAAAGAPGLAGGQWVCSHG